MEKGWIGLCDDEGNEKRRGEMGRKRCRPHRISLDRFPQVQKSKRGEKREGVVVRVER